MNKQKICVICKTKIHDTYRKTCSRKCSRQYLKQYQKSDKYRQYLKQYRKQLLEDAKKWRKLQAQKQKIKVLNLYAGIGGNRKLWKDVDVTTIEIEPNIAKIREALEDE